MVYCSGRSLHVDEKLKTVYPKKENIKSNGYIYIANIQSEIEYMVVNTSHFFVRRDNSKN